jgi:hypothetical protein
MHHPSFATIEHLAIGSRLWAGVEDLFTAVPLDPQHGSHGAEGEVVRPQLLSGAEESLPGNALFWI